MRQTVRSGVILSMLSSFLLPITSANAATIVAAGSNPGICNQTVSDATGVVAYRISGGDCVVEFKNVGTLSWTAPSIVQSAQVLVVAGGGGGGARHSGGGGGGGMLHVTNYKILANTSYSITVGDGGAGAAGLASSGAGNAGNNSSFAGSSGTGSIVANGGGGGGGGGHAANALNYNGTYNATPARGSGGGSNHESSSGGAASPGTTSDTNRAAGTYSMTINGVSASITAYGQAGGVGKGSSCYGPSATYTGWCGGGGGGSLSDGGAPTQPGSVNPWRAGNGGSGASVSITGTSTPYAGGGGGGAGSDKTFATNTECVTYSPLTGNGGTGGGGAGGACLNTSTSGTANTGGGGGGAGLAYVTESSNTQGVGGKGGSGIVILRYTPDTAAPTITNAASPFTFAENTNVSTIAATIEISESSTISLDASGDYLKFSITVVDTDTARIYFLSSPDFESLADLDRNNDYLVYVDLTDLAGNTSTPSFTIRVTNVNESSTIGAPTISGTAYKGVAISLTVTVNAPGKARFLMDGKRIANCLAVLTTGTYPNYTATCSWKPTVTARHSVSAIFTPSDSTFSASTSSVATFWVLKRTTLR